MTVPLKSRTSYALERGDPWGVTSCPVMHCRDPFLTLDLTLFDHFSEVIVLFMNFPDIDYYQRCRFLLFRFLVHLSLWLLNLVLWQSCVNFYLFCDKTDEKGQQINISYLRLTLYFLCGDSVKNPPANSGYLRDVGSIPGSGRSPGGGHGNPLQFSCLENPMDRGA